MEKPRFPLSVTREFMYRARICTGEIVTSDSFRDLYRATLYSLRCDNATCHQFMSAWLEFGYETAYEDVNHQFYCEFEIIRRQGMLWVSTIDQGFTRWGDDKQCVTELGEYKQ